MYFFGYGKNLLFVWSLGLAIVFSGCSQSQELQHPSSAVATFEQSIELQDIPFTSGKQIEDVFPLLIAEERLAIAARDLERLAALWDTNAQIIDKRSTSNTEDDYIWRGISAILDRYEVAVFPFDPPPIEPPRDLSLACNDEQINVSIDAKEQLSCLENGVVENLVLDVTSGGDMWSFVYRKGRWWIWQLKYN